MEAGEKQPDKHERDNPVADHRRSITTTWELPAKAATELLDKLVKRRGPAWPARFAAAERLIPRVARAIATAAGIAAAA